MRFGPKVLEVRDPAHHENDVHRSGAQYLIGDVHVATDGIAGDWRRKPIHQSGRRRHRFFGGGGECAGFLDRDTQGHKTIPAPVPGLDERMIAVPFPQHPTNLPDLHGQCVVADKGVGPEGLEQIFLPNHFAGPKREVSEQLHCFGCEPQLDLVSPKPLFVLLKAKLSEAYHSLQDILSRKEHGPKSNTPCWAAIPNARQRRRKSRPRGR